MHTASGQDENKVLQPVRQKVRVYNPSLLSELLLEAEKAQAQQAQVRNVTSCGYILLQLRLYFYSLFCKQCRIMCMVHIKLAYE